MAVFDGCEYRVLEGPLSAHDIIRGRAPATHGICSRAIAAGTIH